MFKMMQKSCKNGLKFTTVIITLRFHACFQLSEHHFLPLPCFATGDWISNCNYCKGSAEGSNAFCWKMRKCITRAGAARATFSAERKKSFLPTLFVL